jgi:hypothetical protein
MQANQAQSQSSGDWIDWFVFRKGLYPGKLPKRDQWLVWKARELGAVIVDASCAVMAVHQDHDITRLENESVDGGDGVHATAAERGWAGNEKLK